MSAPGDVLAIFKSRILETERAWGAAEGADTQGRDALAAVAELVAFAESALHYVDAAAATMRESHRAAGNPNSTVIAQVVADDLRAALARFVAAP